MAGKAPTAVIHKNTSQFRRASNRFGKPSFVCKNLQTTGMFRAFVRIIRVQSVSIQSLNGNAPAYGHGGGLFAPHRTRPANSQTASSGRSRRRAVQPMAATSLFRSFSPADRGPSSLFVRQAAAGKWQGPAATGPLARRRKDEGCAHLRKRAISAAPVTYAGQLEVFGSLREPHDPRQGRRREGP